MFLTDKEDVLFGVANDFLDRQYAEYITRRLFVKVEVVIGIDLLIIKCTLHARHPAVVRCSDDGPVLKLVISAAQIFARGFRGLERIVTLIDFAGDLKSKLAS